MIPIIAIACYPVMLLLFIWLKPAIVVKGSQLATLSATNVWHAAMYTLVAWVLLCLGAVIIYVVGFYFVELALVVRNKWWMIFPIAVALGSTAYAIVKFWKTILSVIDLLFAG